MQYPIALINITNRCNLKCNHCFVFRNGNPNTITKANEKPADLIVEDIQKLKEKYGFSRVLWMGGEPLLRKDVLESVTKLFSHNTIATNGTIPLFNLGKNVIWSISIDGPKDINDEIRGDGCYEKIMTNLKNLPETFDGDLQAICVISKKNHTNVEELINSLQSNTPVRGIVLSFYVPKTHDTSDFVWKTLKERDQTIKEVIKLKKKYPKFVLNTEKGLRLLFSQFASKITDNCPLKKIVIPFYLGENGFEIPFCCYGNDVDCDLCGSWAVFHTAALIN